MMALLERNSQFDQDEHVREAMKYLEEKKVKTLLRDLTQSLLLSQPADPRRHILEELWVGTGRSWSSSKNLNASCAFLKQKLSTPRHTVRGLLCSAKEGLGDAVQNVSFFSAPRGRGRNVRGLGDAQKLAGCEFLLVDSANLDAIDTCLGEAGQV